MIPTAFLEDLKARGILPLLYKYGMINYKYSTILEVRHKVNDLMRAGKSKGEAVKTVSSLMSLSIQTIYTYLRE